MNQLRFAFALSLLWACSSSSHSSNWGSDGGGPSADDATATGGRTAVAGSSHGEPSSALGGQVASGGRGNLVSVAGGVSTRAGASSSGGASPAMGGSAARAGASSSGGAAYVDTRASFVGGASNIGWNTGAGGSVAVSGGNTGIGNTDGTGGGTGFWSSLVPTPMGGAYRVSDSSASDGASISLAETGHGVQATCPVAASKLAIHYASTSVGTISLSVNGGATTKVNVHSSGARTGSFLNAIVSIQIPAQGTVTVTRGTGDVPVNIDKIICGEGSLGLPPDIWNLPKFKIANGPYSADWHSLGLAYSVPAWWRDAKLGAWAHWDPQSMPEQGDWYAYRMYQKNSADYNYHIAHFGDPSAYGYKDICQNWVIDQWDPSALMALYVQMGAKFFMAMGSHHDNFDCWDSSYQPWNSVNVGVD